MKRGRCYGEAVACRECPSWVCDRGYRCLMAPLSEGDEVGESGIAKVASVPGKSGREVKVAHRELQISHRAPLCLQLHTDWHMKLCGASK